MRIGLLNHRIKKKKGGGGEKKGKKMSPPIDQTNIRRGRLDKGDILASSGGMAVRLTTKRRAESKKGRIA